jgi:hypothetical protein
MSRSSLAVLSAASLVAFSCGGCGSPSFDVTVKGSSTVPGAPGLLQLINDLGPLSGFSDIHLDQSQEFKNQGVSKSQVQSVKVVGLTLQITAPDTQDFSFLKSVQFYASAPNVAETLIAEKSGIDTLGLQAPKPTLTLEVKDAELVQYLTADSMSIRAAATGHQPDQDTTLEAKVTVRITPKLF